MPTRRHESNRFGDSSRFYEVGADSYPSVTTILSVLGKPALIQWAATQERDLVVEAACDIYGDLPTDAPRMMRAVYEQSLRSRLGKVRAFTKQKDKAAEIGSQAHELIEWTMKKEVDAHVGKMPEACEAAMVAFSRYEDWRRANDLHPLMIEKTVYSETYRYAGTADWIGTITVPDGQRCLVLGDWKTGKAVYAEALLQNAAYVAAAREMGHEVDCGCVVRLPKRLGDPGFQVRWVTGPEIDELFPVFLSVKGVWEWKRRHEAATTPGGVGPDRCVGSGASGSASPGVAGSIPGAPGVV
jgi:hypothetical protein